MMILGQIQTDSTIQKENIAEQRSGSKIMFTITRIHSEDNKQAQ